MERAQKEKVLGEIKEEWKNVSSVVIADYRGISVPVVTTMRDDFRKAGCHYRVIKNSLVKIAVKGSKMEPITQLMTGTTAVIWTTGEAPQRRRRRAQVGPSEPGFRSWAASTRVSCRRQGRRDAPKTPGKAEIRASTLMTFLAGPRPSHRRGARSEFPYLMTPSPPARDQ